MSIFSNMQPKHIVLAALTCITGALLPHTSYAQDNFIEYEVKRGDTCIKIARKVYDDGDLCYDLMAGSNEFDEKFRIYPGQILKLPTKEQIKQQQRERERLERLSEGPDAQLKRFRGSVTTREPDASDWTNATKNKDLWRRWRVNSAQKSSAEVFFMRERATLRMRENTLVVIYGDTSSTSSTPSTSRQAVLEKGTLASRLGELSGGSSTVASVDIETPSAVVSTKGGDTLVSLIEGDTTLVANHTSPSTSVRGRTKTKKSVSLPKNTGTKVEKGKDPTPPKPLPNPPLWKDKELAVSSVGGKSVVLAAWDTVKDVAAWRVEVRQASDDALIDVAVLDGKFKEVSFEDFAPGQYTMRIATIDNDGFESKMSDPLKLVVAEILARLDDPAREARVATGKLFLGEELRVQENLDCMLGDQPLRNNTIYTSKSGPQELICTDQQGNPLPPQRFIVQPNNATLTQAPPEKVSLDTVETVQFKLDYPIENIEIFYPEGFTAVGEPIQNEEGIWTAAFMANTPNASGDMRIGTPGILGAKLATVSLQSGDIASAPKEPEKPEKPWHLYVGALAGTHNVLNTKLKLGQFDYDGQLRAGLRLGAQWNRDLLMEAEFDTGILRAEDESFVGGEDRQQSIGIRGAVSYRFLPWSIRPFVRVGGGMQWLPSLSDTLPSVMGGGGVAWVIDRRAEIRLDIQESLIFDDSNASPGVFTTGAYLGFSATF